MHCGVGKVSQMMQELVSNVRGDFVSPFDRKPWIYGYIYLGKDPVAQPPYPHLGDVLPLSYGSPHP